ncbi:MAG TPA: hypothetical protein VNQ53_16085 [Nocardioides sp.]|nr:hypothetical protein [Nocardioides sp.]
MSPAVVHPRIGARRGGRKATSWWGRAWVRAVEESAYGEKEHRTARALARAGAVGGITVDVGSLVASIEDNQGLWTAQVSLPVLDDAGMAALVEVIGAEVGRAPALLTGELPHSLVEHAEEMGVELLPYGAELEASCTCEPWLDPCVHALALLSQTTWLLERDPLVLLHLRGLTRDDLLARLHDRTAPAEPSDAGDADLDVAVDAAVRAARVLDVLDDPEASIDHLF